MTWDTVAPLLLLLALGVVSVFVVPRMLGNH